MSSRGLSPGPTRPSSCRSCQWTPGN